MNKITTALTGLLCFVFSLTAPFVVPFALLCTDRQATKLAWSWYDTPDEKRFIGFYEPAVQRVYDRFGWFIAGWYWFGLRNRSHGFDSLFSREALSHWPPTGSHEREGLFLTRGRWWYIVFSFGWPVYASSKYPSGLEYRPQLSLKSRRPSD